MSPDDAPQPGDYPWRSQEPNVAGTGACGISGTLYLYAQALVRPRSHTLWLGGGADAAMGKAEECRRRASVRSMPGRRVERRCARQWRYRCLRATPANRKLARKILHGDLAFARAGEIRRSIRQKECYCTNEIFMWPSIIFQPLSLARSMIGAKVWERAEPLPSHEKVSYTDAVLPLKITPVE